MVSTRITKSLLCLAASALLCGAPLYAQTEPGMPGSSSQTPGSTSGTSTGRSTSSGSMGDMSLLPPYVRKLYQGLFEMPAG